MTFEEQITDVHLEIDTRPRVFLKWKNTEEGRDKDDCFERMEIGRTIIYINTFNRSHSVTQGHPFWDKLEELYKQALAKTIMQKITVKGKNLFAINVSNNAYRESLVQNPNLTNRYGNLEVTSRETGRDSRFHIPNIEKYEIVGMFTPKDCEADLLYALTQGGCFEKTQKVVVLTLNKK